MNRTSAVDVVKKISLSGHRDCIYTLEPGRTRTFYSAGGDGMIVEWDLENTESGKLIAKVSNSVYALCHLADKDQLLIGENFEGIHLIDLTSKKEIASARITSSSIFDIACADNLILVATGEGEVIVLYREDLSTVFRLKVSEKSARCIAVDKESQLFVVGTSDNTIKVIDLKSFNLQHTLLGHQNSVFSLQFSPDGRYLLSGSRDAHLKVWSVLDNYALHDSIAAHLFAINHIAYRADGRYFATCSMDKSVKIWNAESFRLLKVLDKARHSGHGTSVNKLIWSEHNNELISCSDDRTISVWDLKFNI